MFSKLESATQEKHKEYKKKKTDSFYASTQIKTLIYILNRKLMVISKCDACVDSVISLANNPVRLISHEKLEVQCRYCFQTETQTAPAGPLTFKAAEPESREDAGSLLCLCLLLLFDYWAKLFNQVWNHKKAAVLHCPGTEPLLTEGCFFRYLGTGGSAQLCKSPVAWSLLCKRDTVFGVSCATCSTNSRMEMRGPQAQRRRRLFASLQHLESLWFMWEI